MMEHEIPEDARTNFMTPGLFQMWAGDEPPAVSDVPGGIIAARVPDDLREKVNRMLAKHIQWNIEPVLWEGSNLFVFCTRVAGGIDLQMRSTPLVGWNSKIDHVRLMRTAGQTWFQAKDAALAQLEQKITERKQAAAVKKKTGNPGKRKPPIDWSAIRTSVDMYQVVGRRIALKRAGPHLFRSLCPFHTEKTPSFTVYPGPKIAGGHAYCFGCQKYWDAVSFVQEFEGITDASEAARRVLDEQGLAPIPGVEPIRWVANTWGEWLVPEVRIEVYRDLWRYLTLQPTHRAALVQRGMADDDIDVGEFRSMPPLSERTGWWARLNRDRNTMYGIPGFTTDADGKLYGPTGLLVPVRNVDQNIIAAQIRVDRPRSPNKYLWLSTGHGEPDRPGGGTPGSPPHVAWPHGIVRVGSVTHLFVTEGPLKATITANMIDEPVVGVAGIGRFNSAQPIIDFYRPQYVIVAFDTDVWALDAEDLSQAQRTRSSAWVQAIDAFQKHPAMAPNAVWIAVWDPQDGKGIDDVVTAGHNFDVVPPDQFAPYREALDRLRQGVADS